jgi:hypothetical protein
VSSPVLHVIGPLLGRVARLVDDILPMPADQRAARDRVPLGDDEVSRRQRLRIKLHMLEKRTRGGFR